MTQRINQRIVESISGRRNQYQSGAKYTKNQSTNGPMNTINGSINAFINDAISVPVKASINGGLPPSRITTADMEKATQDSEPNLLPDKATNEWRSRAQL